MRTAVPAALTLTLALAVATTVSPPARAQAPAGTPPASVAKASHAELPRTASPEGAEVYLISPKDGARVKNPVSVVFGLRGMGVAPAGVRFDETGHHHLLIDTDPPADMSAPLPSITSKLVHFGRGQTETSFFLPPGRHTLQLLLADSNHVPHEPPVISKKITITVLP